MLSFRLSRPCLMLFTALALSASFAHHVQAFRVQPMIFDLEPVGDQSETTLRIDNTTNDALTLEFIATSIDFTDDGEEVATPADEDFLIFPPTGVVQSGESQAVRVRYIGEPTLGSSKSYRISIKQVPVDLKGSGETAIGMVVNFNTLANVVPAGASPDPVVEAVEEGSDNGYWDLTIENAGNRYVRLSKTNWTLTDSANKELVLKGEQVAQLVDSNLLLPKTKRAFRVRAIEGFIPETTKITIKPNQ